MRAGTVQIVWHDTKPVLTLDFHPTSGILATGGADKEIKIWQVVSGDPQKKLPTVTYTNFLSYHSSPVNALRFSPSGEFLASGADGGELILWKLHTTDEAQTWKVHKTLAFHCKDILDLQWSSDGGFLISGSVDNSCIIWDVNKGSVHQILDAHLHYVQGVAWDPLGKYVASLSSDRTCRIYINKPEKKIKGKDKLNFVSQHVISKAEQQATTDDAKVLKNHLFLDETLPSFFRRMAWSPDGSFLVAPAGLYKFSPASESVNTAYVFARKDLSRPALQLPGASKPVVAVRFCPVAFSLCGSTSGSGFFNLPYRLVFALATLNSLYIYDTQSLNPIAILAGLHYAAVTDIAWSPDAKYLAVSSQDGYCTLVEFDAEELGSPVHLAGKGISVDDSRSQIPTEAQQMEVEPAGNSGCDVVDNKEIQEKQEKDKKETHEKQEIQDNHAAQPVHLEININDYVSDDASGNYNAQYNNMGKLVNSLESDILSKLNGPSSNDASRSKPSETTSRGSDQPILVANEDRPSPSRIIYPPVNPVGGSDLFPGAGAGIYPTRGDFGGGSMLIGMDDPRWGGAVGGGRPGYPGQPILPPGGIPGARFDPFGPPNVPGFEPDRFARLPRQPGGRTHPDLEQPGGGDFDYI